MLKEPSIQQEQRTRGRFIITKRMMTPKPRGPRSPLGDGREPCFLHEVRWTRFARH